MKPFQLTKEQIEDATKMANTPDLPNFSKAGTGKTHVTLEALGRSGKQHALILAPKIALDWWSSQAEIWLGADVKVIRSAKSKLGGDIHVMTYDIARAKAVELYEYYDKDSALICDESHNVCSITSKRSQALFGRLMDGEGGLVSCFDTAWMLTGTPMPNYANDMWTQVGVLHPEAFARYDIYDYQGFERKFCYRREVQYNPRMRPTWVVKGNQQEMLLNKIVYNEIGAIRRLEAPGLPDLLKRNLGVNVRLTTDIADALKQYDTASLLRDIMTPDSVAAKAWKAVGLAKVTELVPYLGELAWQGPVLLGCWHREVMNAYQAELAKLGLKVVQVNGSTPDSQREGIRNRFNNGEIDVLIGQMKAMGVSWNLQEAARNVVIAESHPSPGVVEQFYKRVYRRGQTRACQVDMVLTHTVIDEGLNGVRLRKAKSDKFINR